MFPERSETQQQLTKKIIGLLVSMTGVILYTVVEIRMKAKENGVAARLTELKKTQNEEDTVLDED
jgi:type VI protein secretion system component VasF